MRSGKNFAAGAEADADVVRELVREKKGIDSSIRVPAEAMRERPGAFLGCGVRARSRALARSPD